MAIVTAHSSAAKSVFMLSRSNSGAYTVTLSSDVYPYGETQVEISHLMLDDLAELHELLGDELDRRAHADAELELTAQPSRDEGPGRYEQQGTHRRA